MKWVLRIGLGLLVLIIGAAIALWIWRPWVPPLQWAEPGPTGTRIEQDGLVANFFPGPDNTGNPGILLLGGSEGGLGFGTHRMAVALQEEGFAVLQLAYHRGPGQPENLEHIPLEHLLSGLNLLAAHPNTDGDRLGLFGVSKGAEAGLLVAAQTDALEAVVLGAPSSVVWPGINWMMGGSSSKSSWAMNGEPLEMLPYGPFDWEVGVYSLYRGGLDQLGDHPGSIIPVEQATAPILLICGENDTLWPACDMSRQIVDRANTSGGPEVSLLAYEDAGHAGIGLPVAADHPNDERLAGLGGTPDGNAMAREESWPQIVAFFATELALSPQAE